MRIGLLTGGGDVPGLNPCIKAVVTSAEAAGIEVVGHPAGWAGLLNYNPDDPPAQHGVDRAPHGRDRAHDRPLRRDASAHVAHQSRRRSRAGRPRSSCAAASPSRTASVDCTPHVLEVLEHLGIDALVPIGGDDTLSFARPPAPGGRRASSRIPKTMDNDVFGTDYCIGFSTAVTRSVEFINAAAHARRLPRADRGRRAVRPQLGRDGADLGLPGRRRSRADLRGAVRHRAARQVRRRRSRQRNPSNYALIVVSEGATMIGGQVVEYGQEDAYGHRKLGGIGEIVAAGAQEDHRRRHRQPAARVPDARRCARFARPDGRSVVRQPRRRAARSEATRDGWSRSRTATTRPSRSRRSVSGRQARRRRRALRLREQYRPDCPPPARQADVPVLIRPGSQLPAAVCVSLNRRAPLPERLGWRGERRRDSCSGHAAVTSGRLWRRRHRARRDPRRGT